MLQHFDANSKDTFHNAFTVFKHWGILKARGERYTSGYAPHLLSAPFIRKLEQQLIPIILIHPRRSSRREVLLHLSPYWQEEKALDALVHHIGSFRREPLRQGSDPTPPPM